MLSASTALPAAPLDCPHCRGFGSFVGNIPCDACHGTGSVRCECGHTPAVTTSLTDRSIKLCASCVADDERDVRAFMAETGLSADAISRFFALAPRLTTEQLHALIPLPIEAYRAEVELLVASDGADCGRIVEIQDGAGNVTYRAPIVAGSVR